jgi:hypothetical protein
MAMIEAQQHQHTKEQADYIERWQADCARSEQESRREIIRLAAVLCSCRQDYVWGGDQSPPQTGCIVHGNVMLTPDGKEIIG